jgi:predicted kinase
VSRPDLVIVTGAPGTGKTTLAERLAGRLSLLLLAKDRLKEPLMDALGVPDMVTQRRLGAASYELMYRIASWSLDAGIGLVLEANFVRGRSEEGLRPLVRRASTAQLVCVCEEATRRARFADRARRGGRHPGHLDRLVLDEWDARPASTHDALELGIPTLVVNTDDGRMPPDDEIARFIRATRQRAD